jgi:hypothetical protein
LTAVLATGVGTAAAAGQLGGGATPHPHQTAGSPATSVAPTGPTTTQPTTPATIPPTAMLTAAELGAGTRAEPIDDLGPDGPDWPWELTDCATYRPADYPSQDRRGPGRALSFARDGSAVATQFVERYPASGAENLDDVRRVLAACARYRVTGPPLYDERSGRDDRLDVIDTGLAGDESLLVRRTRAWLEGDPLAPVGSPTVSYLVVVRRGDLVTTIDVNRDDEQFARQIASRAATHL